MKLRFAKHPYGVPKDDTRFDVGLLRRIWWTIKADARDWWRSLR